MDIETRVPISPLTQLILPDIVLAVLVAVRVPYALKATISLVLLRNLLHTLLTATTGVSGSNYAFGSAVLANTFFNILLFVWIVDPMEEFRYLRDDDPSPLASRSFFARTFNAFCIMRNSRLIGLNVQISNIPPPFQGTRAQFLGHRCRQFLWSFVLTDLAGSYVHSYRHLYTPGPAEPPLPLGSSGFLLRSWNLLVFGVMINAVIKMCYEGTSLLAVGFGLSRPRDWPDIFGQLSDAYTMGRLWGRTWHQTHRRHFSCWGKLVVRALRIPRGTWLSFLVQVWTAFFLSALIHSFGDVMIGKQHYIRSFPFFLSNAAAITFEHTVIALAQSFGIGREGPTRAVKLLGYAWVVLWMRFSAPMFVDWMYESGMVETHVLLFSPVKSLVVPWLHRSPPS
ncbi:membrane bound O-acyl transferase family-domain-containing protein [Cerioporus squamosus]|nr:membrane bound O-acyl transferase family-domain-containing protein [Cerioporus squamosus]